MNSKLLTPRLLQVCQLVPECTSCTDVGCDHAQAAIWLVRNRKVKKMTATDVNQGPIERARHAVKLAGLENEIDCIRCDGLDGIPPQDAVIIAGMGGDLIADILSRAPWTVEKATHLILQPMTAAYRLRKYLYDSGYAITKETYVAEREKLYSIICACAGEEKAEDESCFYISRAGERDSMGSEYALRTVKKLICERDGIMRSEKADDKEIALRNNVIKRIVERFNLNSEV